MEHVLCISGTFNPPHLAHVKMGLHAAAALRSSYDLKVSTVFFLPCSDNYLWNKLSEDTAESAQNSATHCQNSVCLSMGDRVRFLRELISKISDNKSLQLKVLPLERDAPQLLTKSPKYWERKRTFGYLKTVPTAKIVSYFVNEWVPDNLGRNTRVALIFGADNLPWMPAWNDAKSLFSCCDLVIVDRPSGEKDIEGESNIVIEFESEPKDFLKGFKCVTSRVPVELKFAGKTLSLPNAADGSALIFIGCLEGLEMLSSTRVRRALGVLSRHGYDTGGLIASLTRAGGNAQSALRKIRTTQDTHFVSPASYAARGSPLCPSAGRGRMGASGTRRGLCSGRLGRVRLSRLAIFATGALFVASKAFQGTVLGRE
eukprot:g3505.t1